MSKEKLFFIATNEETKQELQEFIKNDPELKIISFINSYINLETKKYSLGSLNKVAYMISTESPRWNHLEVYSLDVKEWVEKEITLVSP